MATAIRIGSSECEEEQRVSAHTTYETKPARLRSYRDYRQRPVASSTGLRIERKLGRKGRKGRKDKRSNHAGNDGLERGPMAMNKGGSKGREGRWIIAMGRAE